ncbi:MAG TPA: hypothetical protein VNO22_09455 [Planctomycetota bacterium]|jgi:uncharacterized membrane protein|nr:hypothetical protein [Planctomycetota bacterium]
MSRVLGTLLAASVAFNAFFVAGYVRSRDEVRRAATPQGRLEVIADRLDLDADQRREFEALRAEWIQKALEVRRPYLADLDAFWAEMMKDAPDAARLAELQKKALDVRVKAGEVSLAYVRAFMVRLRPDQRERYVRLLRPAEGGP